jgi:antitoxin MazE
MQVRKLDDSLAVVLPHKLVQELGLKEGDEVDLRVVGAHELEVEKNMTREEALRVLDELSRPFPPGYKFNRAELYER